MQGRKQPSLITLLILHSQTRSGSKHKKSHLDATLKKWRTRKFKFLKNAFDDNGPENDDYRIAKRFVL